MPIAAAEAASIAAPVAKKAAQKASESPLTPILIGFGALLLLRGVMNLGNFIRLPGELIEDLGEGTGDFLTGAFTGADRTEEITTARTMEQPETVFQLTPGTIVGDFSTFDRNEPTRYVLEFDADGSPIVTIENASPILPPPTFTFSPDVPLAQEIGAAVFFDPVTGLYTDPFIDIGGVRTGSIEDGVNAVKDFFGGLF